MKITRYKCLDVKYIVCGLILVFLVACHQPLFVKEEKLLSVFDTGKEYEFRAYFIATGATTNEYVRIDRVNTNGKTEVLGRYENNNVATFGRLNDSVCLLQLNYVGKNLQNKPDSIFLRY